MALLRYKVLSHYGLGELVYYKDSNKIDDFPLTHEKGDGTWRKCRYDCDISNEDFEKVYEIYKHETGLSETSETSEINNGAEKILRVYALVALVVGIIAFVVCFIGAFSIKEWSLIGTGIGVFLATLVGFAFIKVFVNISYKLDKIANLLNKPEK